ncbi:transposable element Tcb2 transposase [Trichonephila clavipes]|nr:transposable element Tcb2 transposase [Trichonephila clavipes]
MKFDFNCNEDKDDRRFSDCFVSMRSEPFLEIESADRRPRQGRRLATTPNEDRYLVLTARRHRNMNATLLNNTFARLLAPRFQLRLVRKPAPQEWATELVNWRRNEWSNVLFLTNPVFLFIRIIGVFSSGGTMAVGIILRSYTKVSDLAVGERWCPHIVLTWWRISRGRNRTNGMACVFSRHAESNRAHLGRSQEDELLAPTTPTNSQELKELFLEEWDRIPQLVINSLIDSMSQRCSTLLAVRGNHTPY